MAFTKEEFDIMVEELLYREKVSFDMLCKITEKTLKKRVEYLCRTDKYLRGRGYENDILQEIYLRVIKKTVSRFLLKNGVNGEVNNDPDGFKSWLIKLGDNIYRDFSKKVRGYDFRNEDIDGEDVIKIPAGDPPAIPEETVEKLKQSFSIVLSSNSSVYKILTWLALNLIILENNEPKIEANDVLLRIFEEMTLNDMYKVVCVHAEKIPWLEITPEQHAKIRKKLNKKRSVNATYGELRYKEFFMLCAGEKSGKKSVSDWMYRMNELIKKKMEENNKEPDKNKKNNQKKSPKKQGENGTGGARSNFDESSDS